jgi:uncharacterized metal-binding protein YceD (DUF177 family)
MTRKTPEFSRVVLLNRLGSEPFRQRIEATVEERQKLSARFDLLALDRLIAEVEVRREGGEMILLEAEFEAEFEQCCAATLEPVRGAVADRFSLLYGPAEGQEREVALRHEEPAFEPLAGDAIDIGEAVAQELSLSLPDFPRDPEASIDEFIVSEAPEGAFAALSRLRKAAEC